MDLEDELTRLFQDERLDVRVAPHAEQAVVAGARRVRRRRVALISAAGVLGALAVAGGTIVLARGPATTDSAVPPPPLPITSSVTSTSPEPSASLADPTPEGPPPTMKPSTPPEATRATTSISPPRTSSPSPISATVLGPTGYGSLRLGMTEAQLLATGQVSAARTPGAGTCAQYTINGQSGSRLEVSATRGLVIIDPGTAIHTPEGISEGSTVQQAKAKYADYDSQGSPVIVKVPGNPAAWFYLYPDPDGTIGQITLVGSQTECTG
jgi:hypothetical protein